MVGAQGNKSEMRPALVVERLTRNNIIYPTMYDETFGFKASV